MVEEIIVNLRIILACFQVNYSRTFYTWDAVYINQSWPVNNAAITFRPQPSNIETRHEFSNCSEISAFYLFGRFYIFYEVMSFCVFCDHFCINYLS